MFFSPEMLEDLRFHTFSHDHEKFNYAPVCSLTDEQAAHLLTIIDQLTIIANHTDKELPNRHQTLLAQLAAGNGLYAWLQRIDNLLPILQARHRYDSQRIPRQQVTVQLFFL